MANYNENFNDKKSDEIDNTPEKKQKGLRKAKPRQMKNAFLLNETIMRLSKLEMYKNDYELKPFINLANKFGEQEIAISMLHNCHAMRINNNHPSNTRRLAAAIGKALNGSNSIRMLESIVELLSSRDAYEIKDEEIKQIKKNIEKQRSSIKARLNKIKNNKKNKNEEKEDENEIPSEKELKKIEKEFGKIINAKNDEINLNEIE